MDKHQQIKFYNASLNLAQLFPQHIKSAQASGNSFSGEIKATVELVYALHQLKEQFGGKLRVTPSRFDLALFHLSPAQQLVKALGTRTMDARLLPPPLKYSRIR